MSMIAMGFSNDTAQDYYTLPVVPEPEPGSAFVVGIFGQSQPNYLVDTGSFFQQIEQPTPGAGNLVTYTGTPATRTVVTATSVAAGLVNPVMAAWSAFFARLLPGREIVVVDLCEGGTGRGQLMNDAEPGRDWSDLEGVLASVRADYDDIDLIVECWMANDMATAQTMGPEWAPLYMGQRWGGAPFTLGAPNPDSVQNPTGSVDHCLWDIEAPEDAFGRGVFKRARTKLSFVGWPSFNSRANENIEMDSFTDAAGYPTQVDRAGRDSLSALFNDPRIQTFAGFDGFSSHMARMTDGGTVASVHPSVLTPDGQVMMGWPYAASILKGAGYALSEPALNGVTGPDNGSYMDILVDLPNGGTLSTPRLVRATRGAPTRADVERLRLDPAATGCRLPLSALKVPGVDPLPGDFTWNAGTNTIALDIGGVAPDLIGWHLNGVYLDIRGEITGLIADNVIVARSNQLTITGLDIYPTARIGGIEWNTIRGQGYQNRRLGSLITERFEKDGNGVWQAPIIGPRRFNACLSYPNDCWKVASGGLIEFNYFDTPASMKTVPLDWAAGTSYAELDPVKFSGLEYVSLTDGNTANQPSGTTSDTVDWAYIDPHSDVINPRAVIGAPLEIRGNFLNMAQDQRRETGAGEPWGMNNALRFTRNTSLVALGDADQLAIDAHHNIISTMGASPATEGHQVTYPIALGSDNGLGGTVQGHTIRDNWVSQGANGRFTFEADPASLGHSVVDNTIYDRTTGVVALSPHQQSPTGFEVQRAGGTRRPVYHVADTAYPAAHRGHVLITDTGSGTPRQGRVRIIPEAPFAFGDSVDYLRGDAGAILVEPRDTDANLWADMLIEHVDALYDPTATYAMEGVPVRPMPPSIPLPVAAPTFVARGATFDGVSSLETASLAGTPATAQGLVSVWFKNDDATWAANRQIAELRAGSIDHFNLRTNSVGRLRLDLGDSVMSIFAGPSSSTPMDVGQWYHLLAAWDGTSFIAYVNDVQANSQTITPASMGGETITRVGIGDRLGASGFEWLGDMAHLYLNVAETLDITQAANRAKFALAGAPVDLGGTGALPTGTAPAFYMDGDAPAWGNQGTAGAIPTLGAVSASQPPVY